jgi:hypothetical protein
MKPITFDSVFVLCQLLVKEKIIKDLSENRTFQQRFGTRKETTTTWQRQKVD